MVQRRVDTHPKAADAVDGLAVDLVRLLGYLALLDACIDPVLVDAVAEFIDDLIPEIARKIIER